MSGRRLWPGLVLSALFAGSAFASTVVGLSIEDQARLARLVVVGEVEALSPVDDPELGIETAVTLRVIDVLKGQVAAGSNVVFHTREGAIGGVTSEAPGEAQLNVGQKVLVFIESVNGRLYNLGLSMGVWNVLDRDGAIAEFTRAVTDGLEVVGEDQVEWGPVAYGDMASRIAWTASHPEFDSPMLREAVAKMGR